MQAKDVMTPDVVTVSLDTSVADIAKLLIEKHYSALPVVDADKRVLGIVSEADLLHRTEFRTQKRRSWWLSFLASDEALAAEYLKTHGLRAEEVMSSPVITVSEDMPLDEIAQILAEKHIKRIPVVRDGKLVGIVARVDLLRGLAAHRQSSAEPTVADQVIRERLLKTLREEWTPSTQINIIVTDGVVHLWGLVHSEKERQALRLAAETTPGVRAVEDHLAQMRPGTLTD